MLHYSTLYAVYRQSSTPPILLLPAAGAPCRLPSFAACCPSHLQSSALAEVGVVSLGGCASTVGGAADVQPNS